MRPKGTRIITDGVSTNNVATFTSATAGFVAADIGMYITSLADPPLATYNRSAYIASINSPTSVEMSVTAKASRTAIQALIGSYRPAVLELETADNGHAQGGGTFPGTITNKRIQLFPDFGDKPRIKYGGTTAPTGPLDYGGSLVVAPKPTNTTVTVANTTTETTLATMTGRRLWLKGSDAIEMVAWGTVLKNNGSGNLEFVFYPQDATAPATIRLAFNHADFADSATRYVWQAEGRITAKGTGSTQKGFLRVTVAIQNGADVATRTAYELAWTENMSATDYLLASSVVLRAKWNTAAANLSLICESSDFKELA
jgi:hypothetical protein